MSFALSGIMLALFCVSCSTVRTGTWTFVHEDGNVISGTWNYQGDRVLTDPWSNILENATGEMTAWWRHNEAKYYEAFYRNGEPDGLWRIWYPNGTAKCVGYLEDGRRVGVWTWWDEKGRIENREELDGDVRVFVEYWPNGQKKSQHAFRGYQPYGVWIDWDD